MHGRFDDRPQQQPESGDRQDRAHRVHALRVPGCGSPAPAGAANRIPATATGTLIRNTDPHQKWASSRPPTIGPSASPAPLVPDQNPSARWRSPASANMFVMIDSVEGMISAAPTPMPARAAISMPDAAREGRPGGAGGEQRQPGDERPLASDPVGEAARDEHQAAEHQRIGVDDPLELAGGRVELSHERRQDDVQHGVVQRDDQERHTQHRERQPARGAGAAAPARATLAWRRLCPVACGHAA